MVRTVQARGRSIGFRYEPGEGTALVCLHGSADNHHFFDPLLELHPHLPRYAIDAPGRLGSEGPPVSSVGDLAELVEAFIEKMVRGPYVLVGHSLGGAVAIEHALTYRSDRRKGLVLLATGARLRVHPIIFEIFASLVESGKSPEPAPGLFPPGTDPQVIERTRARLALTPAATGLSDWQNADAFDRMKDIDRIDVPTRIVAGSDDTLTPPKYAQYLDQHIPQSRLRVIQGAGHMFPVTHPQDTLPAETLAITSS